MFFKSNTFISNPFTSNLGVKTVLSATLLAACAPSLAYAQHSHLDDPIEFDEIITTGSPLSRSVDEAITGLSVLTSDELNQRLTGTIGETLKYEPGVSSTQFGAGASRPIIRGQSGDRVRVLANGIGSIDASSASPDHAVAVEPAQAERIEVVRGASLLRYGSSGSGGVVNVIDGRIPDALPEDGFDGVVRAGLSSVDDGYDLAGSADFAIGESLVLHLDGTYRDADDYDIPGFAESADFRAREEAEHEGEEEEEGEEEGEEEVFGTLENSAVESQSYTAGLSYIGERGFIGIAYHDFETDYGVPGGHEEGEEEEGEEEEEEEVVTIGLEQERVDINGALELDGLIERIQFFGGYADYLHTEFEGDEVGTVFTNEGYELRIELIQGEQDGWAGAYGAHFRSRDFSAIGEEAFVPLTETEQLAFYTFHEKEIGDWHLEGSARYERTDHDNTDDRIALNFDTLSVSAGADYHFSDALRLGGTVFRTQRAPTTEELFSDGPHLATSQFERGDAELDEETALGAELALRYRGEGRSASVNLFYTSYEDYIFELAVPGEVEDGLDVFQYMSDDAEFTGFELQGAHALPSFRGFDLGADGVVSYVRAETDTDNLPRIPPLSILAGIEAENDQFNLRAEIDYAAEAENLAEEDTSTDDYTQVNLFATWHVPSFKGEQVDIIAGLYNVTDEEARQHTSFLKDLVPLPGRNFKIAARLSF